MELSRLIIRSSISFGSLVYDKEPERLFCYFAELDFSTYLDNVSSFME